jgi:hypothetical protein
MAVALLPNMPHRTVREVTFVAGPARRKTRAAPGLAPFRIRAAAIGVEAVAQMYNGIPTPSITSIDGRPPPAYLVTTSSGMIDVISPARSNPTRNHPAKSLQSSVRAYRSPAMIFSPTL